MQAMDTAANIRAIVDRVRTEIRTRHYSPRTEDAYLGWIVRYLEFHRREPEELSVDDIRRFLSTGPTAMPFAFGDCALCDSLERDHAPSLDIGPTARPRPKPKPGPRHKA
jgi:hypothetical protein